MSNETDRRSVHTDALATLGTIIDDTQKRDAIHLAVIPTVAPCALAPGQHVETDGSPAAIGKGVGIVDPFLGRQVAAGERFWLVIYPRVITSLRHVWEHPAFSQESQPYVPAGASAAERRLREIADALCIDYYDMMSGADEWVRTSRGSKWGGEYLTQHGSENWRDDFPAYVDEFWPLYEQVRGVAVPAEHKQSFFSCSC
jgi:hypothetical protein